MNPGFWKSERSLQQRHSGGRRDAQRRRDGERTWESPTFGSKVRSDQFSDPARGELDASHVVLVQHPAVSFPAECQFRCQPASRHPEAKPGFLCVFRGFLRLKRSAARTTSKPFTGGGSGVRDHGDDSECGSEVAPENRAVGTWAVTWTIGQ